jgi:hypothetical protein
VVLIGWSRFSSVGVLNFSCRVLTTDPLVNGIVIFSLPYKGGSCGINWLVGFLEVTDVPCH